MLLSSNFADLNQKLSDQRSVKDCDFAETFDASFPYSVPDAFIFVAKRYWDSLLLCLHLLLLSINAESFGFISLFLRSPSLSLLLPPQHDEVVDNDWPQYNNQSFIVSAGGRRVGDHGSAERPDLSDRVPRQCLLRGWRGEQRASDWHRDHL